VYVSGTEEYLAPEVFSTAANHRNGEHYTGKVDVWAIGVIYYIMLSGRFPFNRDDNDAFYLITQIMKGDYDMDCLSGISDDSRELITKCLTAEQDSRPTAFEVMDLAVFKNDKLPEEDLMSIAKLSSMGNYKTWRKKRRVLNAVKAIARLKVAQGAKDSHSTGPVSASDQEALDLYQTIHAHGNADAKGLETYEIVLYMQEQMPHLFQKRDRDTDKLVMCSDRVETFSQLLSEKVDLNHDGYISKDEFVKGYCIWQMYIRKAEMYQQSERNASWIYKH